MRFIIIVLFFTACTVSKSNLKKDVNIAYFKERALCNCLAWGLFPNNNNFEVQRLIPYDPLLGALFDSVILENLNPVFEKMKQDSIRFDTTLSEAAHGKPLFRNCMNFYNSKALHNLAKTEVKRAFTIKNIDSVIMLTYPTW